MKEISKPKVCKEDNCVCIVKSSEYNPESPFSVWCVGVRTGVIKGKEKAIKNEPTDVIVKCTLLGSHSEDVGKYTFIENVGDQYLDMRNFFIALRELGLLERTFRSVLNVINEDVVNCLQQTMSLYKKNWRFPKPIVVGVKFVEFSCSCGEIFFREYNYGEGYYKPNKRDEIYFDVHRKLGHEIFYRKAKRVKKSKVGDNQYWQDWELRKYER